MMKRLYFGDNLDVLRKNIPDESVDLVYLDPPFNSNQIYNVFFKSPKGEQSDAQLAAFKDTWHWTEQSEEEFYQIIHSGNPHVANMMIALRSFMQESNMMAYLVMMTVRLLELHRVLKQTGSLYLHCDETVSHYLKMILDTIFDSSNFRRQIIWKRTLGRSHTNKQPKSWGNQTDVILFYARSEQTPIQFTYRPSKPEYIKKQFRYTEPDGRIYRIDNLASPSPRPNLMYEYKGYKPPEKGWAISYEVMEQWDREGRLHFPKNPDGRIQRKRYLDELEGEVIQNLWDDIPPLSAFSKEKLGYPTQKPLALLERIIEASSSPDNVVLDPFCGCGTAVHAAETLGRQWIGIDITHLAITLIEQRMQNAFPEIEFEVEGSPKDMAGARDLAIRDPFQFEWWACSLIKAQPANKQKKGADKGMDGIIYFTDLVEGKPEVKRIIVSIKSGQNVGVAFIRELVGVMQKQNAPMGILVTLKDPTREMIAEATSLGFYEAANGQKYPALQILTIGELLEGQKKPQYFDMSWGAETFKKAPLEKPKNQQDQLL